MFENSQAAPASVVLKELLEGKKASREQQMRMLENRRKILTRCMKNFSQKTLAQLACLDSGNGFYHELREDWPEVRSINAEFRLDSRGFFAGNSLATRKEGKSVTFGIDSDSWLLIKISFKTENRNGAYEKARSVEVTRVDLSTILVEVGLEPSHIWMYFEDVTKEWVSDRKKLYYDARKVEQGMKEESCLFKMIS